MVETLLQALENGEQPGRWVRIVGEDDGRFGDGFLLREQEKRTGGSVTTLASRSIRAVLQLCIGCATNFTPRAEQTLATVSKRGWALGRRAL